jgi:hypothetical protein
LRRTGQSLGKAGLAFQGSAKGYEGAMQFADLEIFGKVGSTCCTQTLADSILILKRFSLCWTLKAASFHS